MRTLLLLAAALFLASEAYAQSIQNFTVVDPKTGHVTMGNVVTGADGSQSYMWNDSTGRSKTDTGYVSPPIGGTSNFSVYDGDTGKSHVGSISTSPPSDEPLFLPTPPSFSNPYDTDSNPDR